MPDQPLPVEFREEIIEPTLSILKSGESCALVGVGNSGKSNVARHLARADVRLRYFGADAAQAIVVYLNCTPLAHGAPHDLYLQALDQLDRALDELDGVFTSMRPGVSALLKEAMANPEALARRNLDLAVGQSIRAGAKHVILLLDDCDDLFAKAPPVLFTDLRGLRDNHKVKLVYVTLSRREPAFLSDAPEYEEFFELVSADGHTLPVTPYRERDGLHMLRRLADRQTPPRRLSDAEVHRLYELSGGHAGLLRTLFFAAVQGIDALAPDALNRLAANAGVEGECQKIVDSLEEEERIDLQHILLRQAPSADGLRRLQKRGLARVHPTRGAELFSPAFERMAGQLFGLSGPATPRIDFLGGNQVRVNDELITTLIRPEVEILRRLVGARPRPCPRVELIVAMRDAEEIQPTHDVHGDPLRRLEQYVYRLKAKLGEAGHFIRPEGDGYALAD